MRSSNRLAHEKSPYLLQHATNPVDWYPWGPEAFEKARREDKPVLLSIGYSTCHWCHVMEEESFENEKTAALMNQHFVSIKVDREERPDLDALYMSYVIGTTGAGGWPMTVFLAPDQKPFYGGMYFPPEDRHGMPGFPRLLEEIAAAWKTRREEIMKAADSAAALFREERAGQRVEIGLETLQKAYARFTAGFDERFGGFLPAGRQAASAPKFPRSPIVSFILRQGKRMDKPRALEMAEKTLTAMAEGGLYDQLDGGFHRYSTDVQWRIPHFEKMLYDQALLAATYLEAYQATHKAFYARIARETLDYVLRQMTAPEGGFYSAQDADSEDPFRPGIKREGAYFVWKKEEIDRIFPKEEADIVSSYFGIEEHGNALADPQGEFRDQNVLYVAHPAQEADKIIDRAKKTLLQKRSERKAPHLDDKILADWNGLMIAALSEASRVLKEPRYREAACRAGHFILKNLARKDGRLFHRYRDGEAAVEGHLNDYAFLVYGFAKLYEATFDEKWLLEARSVADKMIEYFWDGKNGGFYLVAADAEKLIGRPKEFYDGAIPSGNSVAALGLRLLERLSGQERYRRFADELVAVFSGEVEAEPTGYPLFLLALGWAAGPSMEVVFSGDPADPALEGFLSALYGNFNPNKAVSFRPGAGRLAVSVCRDRVCALPVTDVNEFVKMLE